MRFKVANYSRLEIRLDTLHIYTHPAGNNAHQFQGQKVKLTGKLMPELPTQSG